MHASGSRKHKRDATHGEVAKTLTAFGWSVFDASKMGAGCPDLIIGRMGVTDLIEVKADAGATYTPDQRKFNQTWRGADAIRLENAAQAEAWCRRTIRDRQALAHSASRALTPLVVAIPTATAERFDGRHSGRTKEGQ